MRKKKLFVIIGSGSSVEYGIPNVSDINKHLFRYTDEFEKYRTHNYFKDAMYYSELSRDIVLGYPSVANFEDAIGLMLEFVSWCFMENNPLAFIFRPTSSIGNDESEENRRKFLLENINKSAAREIAFQINMIINEIGRYIKLSTDKTEDNLSSYTQFFREIENIFNMKIYNLNYDNLAMRAMPDYFFGFDGAGTVDSRRIFSRNDQNTLFHLHGSINFCIERHDGMVRIVHNSSGNSHKNYCIIDDNYRFNRNPINLHSAIVTGKGKLNQILHEPYSSFLSTMIVDAHEAEAFLFCGYGFSDRHINKIILNALMGQCFRQKILIIDHNGGTEFYGIEESEYGRETWRWEILGLLSNSLKKFDHGEYFDPDRIFRRQSQGYIVEYSSNYRVAIWYDGFRKILKNKDFVRNFFLKNK